MATAQPAQRTFIRLVLNWSLAIFSIATSTGCGVFSLDNLLSSPSTQNPAPPELTQKTIAKIYSGFGTCVSHDQGTHCWGPNSYGEIGLGYASISLTEPTSLVADAGIEGVALGLVHSCIQRNGGVKCVGMGLSGQLGNAADLSSETPVVAYPENSGVTAIAAGGLASCAIKSGGLFCWGNNGSNQIGDGTSTSRNSPVEVFAINSGVEKVAMGSRHTCAIVASELWCWGVKIYGQVGDGTTSFLGQSTPIKIASLGTGVTDISLGENHTCAVKDNGVWCWGLNSSGQLGDGTLVNRNVPTRALPDASAITALSLGNTHSCVISSGELKCWGSNRFGQMNDTLISTSKSTPFTVFDATHQVTHLASGFLNVCVAKANKDVICWGGGMLGNGFVGSSVTWSSPEQVVGLATGVEKLSKTELLGDGSHFQSCAIQNGGLKCWGANASGFLGDGTTTSSRSPVTTFADGSGVTDVALISGTENASGCAVVNGGIQCWGAGYGLSPLPILAAASGATSVSLTQYDSFGDDYGCAVVSGGVQCWGVNTYGQLGNGGTSDSLLTTVVAIAPLSGTTHVDVSQGSSCAIVNGGLRCWGFNSNGQLGDGTTTTRTSPVQIIAALSSVTDVAIVGDWNSEFYTTTCAVVGGGLKCWGRNSDGLVGDGTTTDRLSPVEIFAAGSGVTRVWGRNKTICAIKNGGLYCWGLGNGALGTGNTANRTTPGSVIPENSGVTDFDVGSGHGCAIVAGGLKCWGNNSTGVVGDGTTTTRLSPVSVFPAASNVQEVRVTYYDGVACARVDGAMKCWGQEEQFGVVGNGKVSRGEFDVSGF